MAKAKLNPDVKAFIVQGLACFDPPSVVVASVKREFGLEVSRQLVETHDPTKRAGRDVAARWSALFHATRKAFLDDTAEIGISHKSVRLRALNRMAEKAENTGTVTATASGIEAAKAHSTLQAWALALKDALEQAFVFTAMWTGADTNTAPEVSVHTDFAVGLYGAEEVRVLLDARKEAQISRETFWDEMQRRGVLGPQFDREKEEERLLAENPPFDPNDAMGALMPPNDQGSDNPRQS